MYIHSTSTMKLNNRNILAAALLACCSLTAPAQKLVVDNTMNHVGEVMFQTPRQVVYNIQNKGKKPLIITDVKPSCGCTEADWTRGEIAPGQKGHITATYNAEMLGTFRKELAVYSNASDKPIYLQMEGRVVTTKIDYTGDFPIDLGNIRLNTNYIEFDDVNRGDHPVAELQIFNQERTPFRPELMHLPAYLTMQAFPEVIAGGRTGRVRITLDSQKLGLLGLNQTRVYISRFMGDKVGEANEILVSAVLLPDFSNLTEAQLATAPVMTLSQDELTFQKEGKSKQTQEILVTNNGQETLNIRTVQVFNQAISVSLGDRTLLPGKSTKMKVTLNTKYLKKAKNRPRVLLISNDPKTAKKVINVNLE